MTAWLIVPLHLIQLGLASGRVFPAEPSQIKAFCIDFNWGPGGVNGFAGPGHWAEADPQEHVQWYQDLGCNTIQTFAVSCNGYAWYKHGIIPEQPGLKHDFLTEMVKLGHQRHMKVFGYFCVGANTKWGQEHPDLSYGFPSAPHIPFTSEYLEYLGASIKDALQKTRMDGFMIDWVWNPDGPMRWLACEQQMYRELINKPFPGKENITPEETVQFRRRAIDRCWQRIREAAKGTTPGCTIWLSCNKLTHPDIAGSALLKEVDWVMNEAPDRGELERMRGNFKSDARLLQCMVGWGDQHNPKKILADEKSTSIDIYGFTPPLPNSLPLPVAEYLSNPIDKFTGNDRNIAVLARYYNRTKLEELKVEPPAFSLRRLPLSDSAEISLRSENQIKNLKVRYTTDGAEPVVTSPEFSTSLRMRIPSVVKAASFFDGNRISVPTTFEISGSLGCRVHLKNEPGEKYRGSGGSTLTDGILGTSSYTGGQWLGFEGDDCEAVVDLGETKSVRMIALEYLVNVGAWIFEPAGISFEISLDGTGYTQVGEVRYDETQWNIDEGIRRFSKDMSPTNVRYVKVTVKNRRVCPHGHPGEGGKAWILIDQIIVN